jgi:lipopolysaccharide assembly outer membrane protein LptD (OstA)
MLVCKSLNYYFKNIIVIQLLCLFNLTLSYGQEQTPSDTIPDINVLVDSLSKNQTDTSAVKSLSQQKANQIDAEINYSAKDSIVFFGNGVGVLHGEGDMKYRAINLKANYIRVSMDSSLVYSKGYIDSLGVKTGEPEFTEGEKSYSSKELTYNLKSKKGYIRQAVTQEGEGYIISERTKKTENDEYCMTGGKFTTCDRHDHPDFYLSISKGKVKPGSYIITGPAHLVIADVPLPIAIPFGFFPFTSDYSSGVLMPNYTDELNRGFGLNNGGYYFAISDYADLEVRGDIYTKGTWAVRTSSTYMKRYKFRGSLGIEYRNDVTSEKGMSDYSAANSLRIAWSHSQDQKANPNFTFSSSVNFSTSGFNQNNINYYNRPEINSQNTTSSSINFTKRFPNIPSLSFSGGMSVSQRTKDSTMSLSLPNVSIAYSRFYPFKRKVAVGNERWYEKISMSYSGSLANSIDNVKENVILKSSLQRDWRNGMRHSIPVSATFNLLKYINVSPSINYTERWYLQSVNKSWDKDKQKEKVDTLSGFNRVYDFNMGVSASTKLYGFYIPISAIFGDKIERIRHVMTPSVGFGYTPDFGETRWGYYDTYQKSVSDPSNPGSYINSDVNYSHYDGSLYGSPGRGKSGSINFSLGNNVEMKLRNDKDTTDNEPTKIVSLIDNLSIGGNYNLAVDSMRWSNFSVSLRLKLTKSYSLSLSTSFDPYTYALNEAGNPVRINKLRWENGGFPSFQGTSTSYSYTLSNDTFKKLFEKKEKNPGSKNGENVEGGEVEADNSSNSNTNNTSNAKPEETKSEDGYQKVTVPWSISINYSVQYGKTAEFDLNRMDYKLAFTHNLSLSGNISLTENWKISANSTYDFEYKQFTYTNINVTRSLHCWNMSGSIVPFGAYKSYSFHIGVNASMLADLKYDKQSDYGGAPISWY